MEQDTIGQEGTLKSTLRAHPRLASAVFATLVLLTTVVGPAAAAVMWHRG